MMSYLAFAEPVIYCLSPPVKTMHLQCKALAARHVLVLCLTV